MTKQQRIYNKLRAAGESEFFSRCTSIAICDMVDGGKRDLTPPPPQDPGPGESRAGVFTPPSPPPARPARAGRVLT